MAALHKDFRSGKELRSRRLRSFLRHRFGYETEPILRHLRRIKPDAEALRVR